MSEINISLSRRNFIKRSGQVLGSTIALASMADLLSACGGGAPSGSGNVTLRYSMLQDAGEIANAKALATAFSQANPTAHFTYEPIIGTNYEQKILTEAAGNTLPDIFWLADVLVPPVASKNLLLPLDSYLSADLISDIYPSMLGLGKYNGKICTIPRDYNHVVTYYNKDAFRKAGLADPSMDWTWDDFLAACNTLVKKGVVKYAINYSIYWAVYVPVVRGFGGDMLNPDGKTVAFTSDAALAGLKAFTDPVLQKYAYNPANPPTNDPFITGDAAMSWSVRPACGSYASGIGNKFAWDATRFPKLPVKPVIGAGMSGYAVSAQSPNKDLAANFVKFIVSPEGQKVFEKTGNSVPVLKSLQNDSTWLSLPRPDFNNQAFFYDNQYDTLPPAIPPSVQATYDNAISDAFTSVFLGKSSVEAAFKQAADTINNALAGA
jgi:multiple sugar transport system substrate-binding protein